jgi:hypothetical protein
MAAFASSYIPTGASTVTRSADVASVDTLSPWFNATEGTLFAEVDTVAPTSSANKYVAELSDGTTNNRTILYIGDDAFTKGFIAVSGAAQASLINSTTISANIAVKQSLAYEVNNIGLVTNGGTVDTDTSASIPTVSILRIGAGVGAEPLNGHLRRIAYYPRRLTNAELQALTA